MQGDNITIVCTLVLATLIVSLWFYGLYRKEREKRLDEQQKRNEEFQKELLTKLDKAGLSDREKEVDSLIRAGKTSKEIAEELFIAKSTVDTHRKNINMKFKDAKIKKQIIINY